MTNLSSFKRAAIRELQESFSRASRSSQRPSRELRESFEWVTKKTSRKLQESFMIA